MYPYIHLGPLNVGTFGLMLWLAAVTVWGLALLADALPDGRLVYAVGLMLLLCLAVGAVALLRPRR